MLQCCSAAPLLSYVVTWIRLCAYVCVDGDKHVQPVLGMSLCVHGSVHMIWHTGRGSMSQQRRCSHYRQGLLVGGTGCM